MQAVASLPGRVEGVPLAGLAGAEIVGLAERLRPDLIVMGAAGGRAIRMVAGGVSDRILKETHASVLVARQRRPVGG
ncbi:MAG: universal stress protein [Dehalococcoidia bacterium]|nr:universal stress protein [Dehalococcoidia bacterium]